MDAPPAEGGKSIVFEAVDTGDAAFVRALVEAGADAKRANDYGVPPLAEAARTGNLEMCEVLLGAGADPNAAPGGFPLLYGPVNENHLEVVRLLLASPFALLLRLGWWPKENPRLAGNGTSGML